MKNVFAGLCVMACSVLVACGSDDDDDSGNLSNPIEACKTLIGTVCKKTFGCLTKEEQEQVAPIYGNNESDCRTKLGTSCTEEGTRCDSGTSYSSSMAKECLNQFKSLSCSEVSSGSTPAACDEVCQ